jgi:MFS family permease
VLPSFAGGGKLGAFLEPALGWRGLFLVGLLPAGLCCPRCRTRRGELFRYPRSMAVVCLTSLSQTTGVGMLLWATTLFVLVC